MLFSVLSAWVASNAYGGKLKEMEVSQGKSSISLRQAAFEAEYDEMMERLSKIIKDDSFDNTKRINMLVRCVLILIVPSIARRNASPFPVWE